MATMSDLSEDLVALILARVPVTSLRSVRCTCKKWNDISRNQLIGKSASNQFQAFFTTESKVFSVKFDLQGIRSNNEDEDEFVDPAMKEVSRLEGILISEIQLCDGLMIGLTKGGNDSRLFVWNPYLDQLKWIQPRNSLERFDEVVTLVVLGYDKDNKYKIMRSVMGGHQVYDFSSDSWRVVNFESGWINTRWSSLKGNAYFFGQDENLEEAGLRCFDFTTESFGPFLPHPFTADEDDTMMLSCVREEQLAALYQQSDQFEIFEIWVTSLIQPDAVSWTKFLKVELNGFPDGFLAGSFFIDQEKRLAVVLDVGHRFRTYSYQTAYIFGHDGYFLPVDIREATTPVVSVYPDPFLCTSAYVPSLLQLQIDQPDKDTERTKKKRKRGVK